MHLIQLRSPTLPLGQPLGILNELLFPGPGVLQDPGGGHGLIRETACDSELVHQCPPTLCQFQFHGLYLGHSHAMNLKTIGRILAHNLAPSFFS